MIAKINKNNIYGTPSEDIVIKTGNIYMISSNSEKDEINIINALQGKHNLQGIQPFKKIIPIRELNISFKRLSYLFSYPTALTYLINNTNMNKEEISLFLVANNIQPNDLIVSLGYSDIYLLSLKIFLLNNKETNQILINFNKLDFDGMQRVYRLIEYYYSNYCFVIIYDKAQIKELSKELEVIIPFCVIELL
jgi:hypothetical protein